jgi:hypothetical protein
MNIEELEDALEDILPNGFSIETDNHGQIIIYTGLAQDDDGELIDFVEEDEEDEDADPDFEPLEDEELDEDEE